MTAQLNDRANPYRPGTKMHELYARFEQTQQEAAQREDLADEGTEFL